MEEIKENGFCEKIDKIHRQIQEEQNPGEKKILSQKLIVEVWKEVNLKWSQKYRIEDYNLEITMTTQNCLKNFDCTKNKEFSHYLLKALKQELQKAERKEQKITHNETAIEQEPNADKEISLLDKISLKACEIHQNTPEKNILLLSILENEFKKYDEAMKSELKNKKLEQKTIKTESALLTQLLLQDLNKASFGGLENRIKVFAQKYHFINPIIWENFFTNRILPTQTEVAISFGYTKSRARHILDGFFERIEKYNNM